MDKLYTLQEIVDIANEIFASEEWDDHSFELRESVVYIKYKRYYPYPHVAENVEAYVGNDAKSILESLYGLAYSEGVQHG